PVGDRDLVSRPEAAARTHERGPRLRIVWCEEEQLGRTAAGAPSEQTGGAHAAAVHDQEVAGRQQLRQLTEDVVRRAALDARQAEQGGGVARCERLLRDRGRREVVVEVGESQNRFDWPGPPPAGTRPKCW